MKNIEICSSCVHRKFELKQGVLCGLTGLKPDFTDECPDYLRDESVVVSETVSHEVRYNGKRAHQLLVLMWIFVGYGILSGVSSWMQLDILSTVAAGGDYSMSELEMNDLREGLVGILGIVLMISGAVLFIRWFRRAYFNLHQNVKNLKYKEEWAAFGWFIPFINFWRPFLIMQELFVESVRYFKKERQMDVSWNAMVLYLWWAVWIANGIFGNFSFRYIRNAETIEDYIFISELGIYGGIFDFVLALLALKLVRDYRSIELLWEKDSSMDIEEHLLINR